MKSNIIILSDEVQKGKTTALGNLTKTDDLFEGFLTPVLGGLRYFLALSPISFLGFEKTERANKNDLKVGKFKFYYETFQIAKKMISQLHLSDKKYLVIDEIGKLEVENSGFEPELGAFLEKAKYLEDKTIILIIRKSLLDICIEKYNLQDATVLNIRQFKIQFLQ